MQTDKQGQDAFCEATTSKMCDEIAQSSCWRSNCLQESLLLKEGIMSVATSRRSLFKAILAFFGWYTVGGSGAAQQQQIRPVSGSTTYSYAYDNGSSAGSVRTCTYDRQGRLLKIEEHRKQVSLWDFSAD